MYWNVLEQQRPGSQKELLELSRVHFFAQNFTERRVAPVPVALLEHLDVQLVFLFQSKKLVRVLFFFFVSLQKEFDKGLDFFRGYFTVVAVDQ